MGRKIREPEEEPKQIKMPSKQGQRKSKYYRLSKLETYYNQKITKYGLTANPKVFFKIYLFYKLLTTYGLDAVIVPANEIVGLKPGEIFVHRNIANLVIQSDLNCLSVLQYAVEHLKVKHVIVCGHYGCGGVAAALKDQVNLGLVSNWTRTLLSIFFRYYDELNHLELKDKINRLCEINVMHQVINVCQSTILQDAWNKDQDVQVHGFVYNINDGILLGLGIHINNNESLKKFRQDVGNKHFIPNAHKLFLTEEEKGDPEQQEQRSKDLYY